MGQARKRGTFEQRKSAAIDRQQKKRLEEEALQKQRAEKIAAVRRKQDEEHNARIEAWEAAGADPEKKPIHPRDMTERRRRAVVSAAAMGAAMSGGIGVLR